MKVRLLVVAALCGALLCSCGNKNKRAHRDDVYKEQIEITTVETNNDVVRSKINVQDSLVMDPTAGAVINERFLGLLPAADGPGINYDLILVHQEGVTRGVYVLVMTYLEAENGRDASFTQQGRYETMIGKDKDAGNKYILLQPFDGDSETYFIIENDGNLTLVGQDMKRSDSKMNYTLKRSRM